MAESSENTWLSRQELADRYWVPVKTPAEWASKGTVTVRQVRSTRALPIE